MAYVLDCQGAVRGSVTPTLREHDMSLRLPTVLPMRPDDASSSDALSSRADLTRVPRPQPVRYAPGAQTMHRCVVAGHFAGKLLMFLIYSHDLFNHHPACDVREVRWSLRPC